jgi:hypothetical protein
VKEQRFIKHRGKREEKPPVGGVSERLSQRTVMV